MENNIILIDDSKTFVSAFSQILKKCIDNVKITTFTCPEKALEYIKKNKNYKLAILDWEMPGVTGDVLSVILKECIPQIKTMLITASTDDIFTKRLSNYKFDSIMKKSDKIEHLLEKVKLLLN